MYKHLLFDLDNTLLDFNKAEYVSLINVLKSYDIAFTDELFRQYEKINSELWNALEKGVVTKDYVQTQRFESFFKGIGLFVNGSEANRRYQSELKNQSWLMPGALELTSILFNQGYTISVITNGVGETQKMRVSNSAINDYISYLFISEEIGVEKPNPHFFERVLFAIGMPPKEECLIIGDSLSSDISGGENFGIDTCYFNLLSTPLSNNINPTYVINDLQELLDIL